MTGEATTGSPENRRRRRFFEPLPFSMALVLAVLVGLSVSVVDCAYIPNLLGYVGLVAVLVMLWANHLRFLHLAGWRKLAEILLGWLQYTLQFFLLCLLVSAPLAAMQPTDTCYDFRSRLIVPFMLATQTRQQIDSAYASRHSLDHIGAGLRLPEVEPGTNILVTDTGTVIALRKEPTGFVMLTPHPGKDGLDWSCSGAPAEALPGLCK